MNRTGALLALLMLVVFIAGIATHIWLGIMDESGRWPVPDEVLESLNWAYKMSFGSFLTLIPQTIGKSTGSNLAVSEESQTWPPTS